MGGKYDKQEREHMYVDKMQEDSRQDIKRIISNSQQIINKRKLNQHAWNLIQMHVSSRLQVFFLQETNIQNLL